MEGEGEWPKAPTQARGLAESGCEMMLAWIQSVVAFGTRRPGYPQSLQMEQWLEDRLREFGLAEIRREAVPVNC